MTSETMSRLRKRAANQINEHEIFRIAGHLQGLSSDESTYEARNQILAWAQNRCGGKLPSEAWKHEGFEFYAGGRNSSALRLETDAVDFWCLRAEDPDSAVAGRVWTIEVIIASFPDRRPYFSLRQIVTTQEIDLKIEPAVPGLIRQIVSSVGLTVGEFDVDDAPWLISRDEEAQLLCDSLMDDNRPLPIVVLSGDAREDDRNTPVIDPYPLARALTGLAQVVVVPADQTHVLTARLGAKLSVFHGAIRYYKSKSVFNTSPYNNRLFLKSQISDKSDSSNVSRIIRLMAANDSINRYKLGVDVIPFAHLKNIILRSNQSRLENSGASVEQQLDAAKKTLESLEAELEESLRMQDFFSSVADSEKDRAELAEDQLRSYAFQIQNLRDIIASSEKNEELLSTEDVFPTKWEEFIDWIDSNFAGRISLTSSARRELKDPQFEDIDVVCRCIKWLGGTYRDGRISGADGSFREHIIEAGIRNSLCGGDEYEIEWQGGRYTVDWHVKNGGNTRDPKRCLRIYYFWEPSVMQVVISHLPTHRRTSMT